METKANYVLIGFFTLVVLAGGFGFVHWFRSSTVTGTRATYHVVFQGSVGGLRKGSTVEFNGMRVGEVADLQLDKRDPKQVLATISVDSNVPIRNDTYVRLEFAGLTGVASVELKGGDPLAGPVPEGPDGIPTMIADPSATQDLSGAARELISKLDRLVGDNSALHRSLDNIEAFTVSLKNNSERFDRIMAGLEGMTGTPDKPRRTRRSGQVDTVGRWQSRQADRRDGARDHALCRAGPEESGSLDCRCAARGLDRRSCVPQHRPKSVAPDFRRCASGGPGYAGGQATAATRHHPQRATVRLPRQLDRVSNECAGFRLRKPALSSRNQSTIYSIRPEAWASIV